jgi:phosphoglycerol transferase MdoB-like AlkP superfamily enzyme
LLHEGAYCKNSFANALRSAQGIVAITAGIPQLMDDALQFSPYQNNQINSFASLLKPKGYYSAFFHGSKPGSMMFDKYAGLAMYDLFEDKTAYPNPADDDGNWGIYDVPYFQYVVKKMNEMPQPFHTFTFSLTSHYPYVAEPWFEKKYPNMEAYQRCVLYSDYALRKFFESASKQKWFENTIFVISADHTGPFPRPQYQTRLGRFRVPILFYSTNPIVQKTLNQKLENTTLQQIDILPSVMGLLHFDQNFKTFGKNIFDKKNDNTLTVNYIDGIYQVISPEFNLLFDGQKTIGMYEYQKDIYLMNDVSEKFSTEKKRLEDYVKAIIQVHHNAMIDNKIK